jgi:predicted RNase H-like HicB family nuclease
VSNHYTYRVSWSQDDGEHVATCAEFPSLSWLASDEIEALRGIKDMVREVVEDMRANNVAPSLAFSDSADNRSVARAVVVIVGAPGGRIGRQYSSFEN